jgi:phosphoglycerate dehydrogenase-like enzyme
MRIALLDVARTQGPRLSRLLGFAHEFVAASDERQTVDAVVALRFGRAESDRYRPGLLHLPGAGADAVDFTALTVNCTVCNVFEHEVPVAEFVLAAVLDHAIGYSRMIRSFDSEKWSDIYFSRRPHAELSGKILGLVGYGHIGRAVAQRAKAFGMRVHAISQSGHAPEADWTGKPLQLEELLTVADFVVIACPLTAATHGLIDAKALDAMKPSAVLINIGRAQIVDEEALFRALEKGRIAGATLDVWYQYPTAGDPQARPSRFPFERLPNVHCTAHSSAWTEELFERRYAVIADNLTRLHERRPLRNVIYHPVESTASAFGVDGGSVES